MARRRLDHLRQIGFLDVESPRIGQHQLELLRVEGAVDHHHDGEIAQRLARQLVVLQHSGQVDGLDRGQGADIGEISAGAAGNDLLPRMLTVSAWLMA